MKQISVSFLEPEKNLTQEMMNQLITSLNYSGILRYEIGLSLPE